MIKAGSEMLWTQFWQVTLLALCVAVVSRFCAQKRPHLVYVLWIIVFLKCITPPILHSPTSVYALVASTQKNQVAPADIKKKEQLTGLIFDTEELKRTGSDESQSDKILATQTAANRSDVNPTDTIQSASHPVTSVNPTQSLTISELMFVGWLSVGALFAALIVFNWIKAHRLIAASRMDTPDWLQDRIDQLATKLGIWQNVQGVVTNEGFGPFAMGWIRPRVVLPSHMISENFRENLEPILAHELCHIRRGDTLVNFVQCIAQVVFWFHPLIWWGRKSADRICEMCCDEEAISVMKYRRKRYAESLLAVVDAGRQLRPALAISEINSAEVTMQRMREIMKAKSTSQTSRFGNWIIALALMAIVIPAAGLERTATGQEEPLVSDGITQVRQTLGQGKFKEAEEMCRALIEANDQNANAVHLLGYTLHAQGKLDEALKYHKQATKFDETRGLGLYNWACVMALTGEKEKAYKKLDECVELGLRLRVPITEDTDFESLFEEKRFKKIAAQLAGVSDSDSSAMEAPASGMQGFTFWVGKWEVVNTEGDVVGYNRISMEESGNLIREQWKGKKGTTGQSINYFDPDSGMINQTWVDSKGQLMEMSGKLVDGAMHMSGTAMMKGGKKAKCKMVLKPLDDGRVHQLIKMSKDKGESWEVYFEGFYQKEADSAT